MTGPEDEPKTSIDDFDSGPGEGTTADDAADHATGDSQAKENREHESPS